MSRLTNEDWAEICSNVLASLSHKDRITVLGLAIAKVASGGTHSSPEPVAVAPPQPPKEVKDTPSGRIVAHPGDKCYCSACKTNIYEVTAQLYETGLSINTFLKSFKPLGAAKEMTRDTLEQVLPDGKGNLFIDCGSCGGKKTLRLIRGEEVAALPTAPLADGAFTSIDPKSIGV